MPDASCQQPVTRSLELLNSFRPAMDADDFAVYMSREPIPTRHLQPFEQLTTFDTPTICNALEVIDPASRSVCVTVR